MKRNQLATIGIWVFVAIIFAAFVFGGLLPYLQETIFFRATRSHMVEDAVSREFIFRPYTRAQPVIRTVFVNYALKESGKQDTVVLGAAMDRMFELLEKNPLNPYGHILLGEAYDEKARTSGDASWYLQADDQYKKAMALSLARPDFAYYYGQSLVARGDYDGAIALLRATLERDSRVYLSHYYLGLALASKGQETYPEALDRLEYYLDWFYPWVIHDPKRVKQTPDSDSLKGLYLKFFKYFYRTGDIVRFEKAARRLGALDTAQGETYLKIAEYVADRHVIPPVSIK